MFKEINLDYLLGQMILIARFEINSKKDRKIVQEKIQSIVKSRRITHAGNEYNRAIGNAVHHGEFPVKCYIYINDKHEMLCVVKDAGPGFDYQSTIQKFKKGEVYYSHHGKGMRSMSSNPHLDVDWENHGATIMMYYH